MPAMPAMSQVPAGGRRSLELLRETAEQQAVVDEVLSAKGSQTNLLDLLEEPVTVPFGTVVFKGSATTNDSEEIKAILPSDSASVTLIKGDQKVQVWLPSGQGSEFHAAVAEKKVERLMKQGWEVQSIARTHPTVSKSTDAFTIDNTDEPMLKDEKTGVSIVTLIKGDQQVQVQLPSLQASEFHAAVAERKLERLSNQGWERIHQEPASTGGSVVSEEGKKAHYAQTGPSTAVLVRGDQQVQVLLPSGLASEFHKAVAERKLDRLTNQGFAIATP